jgi:hypothetical protein
MKIKLLISILTLTIFNVAHANEFKVSIDKVIPLFGGFNSNKDYLQGSGTSSDQIGLLYYPSKDSGFYYGLIISKEVSNYTQANTSSRNSGSFSSNYLNIGPELGLWVNTNYSIRIESGITVSNGSFEFKESTQAASALFDTKKVDIHFNLIYPLDINANNSLLDLNAKMGYYKIFLPEFNYNGVSYTNSEINLKQYLYFSFGAGFRF